MNYSNDFDENDLKEEVIELEEEKLIQKQTSRKYIILLCIILFLLIINILVLPKQDGSIAYFNVLVFEILLIICFTRILKIDDFLSVIIEIISQARKK